MELPVLSLLSLNPMPSHGLLPSRRQVIHSHYGSILYGPGTGLLSSAPDFGRDRRDLDHRRPGRRGAIRQSPAGRACASLGADAEAARPGARRSRGIAGYRALYAARGEPGRAAGDQMPRPRPAASVAPLARPAP